MAVEVPLHEGVPKAGCAQGFRVRAKKEIETMPLSHIVKENSS
jgi:hypothetical protein